jgi:hypothetical protein
MKRVVFTICLALFLPTAAAAADWIYIGSEKSKGPGGVGTTWAVDQSSIKSAGPIRLVWVQLQTIAKGAPESHVVRKTYFRIHCEEATLGVSSSVSFDEQGSVTSSLTAPKLSSDVPMQPVVPDSMGEAVFEFVCK